MTDLYDKIQCASVKCENYIFVNEFKRNLCKICLVPFCSQKCLIDHITLSHIEPNPRSGHLIPQASLYQSSSFYDVQNFEKVQSGFQSKILGEGAFGVVYLVRHKQTNSYYAMKQIPKAKLKSIDVSVIQNECQIHVMLSHENICKLYAYRSDEHYYYMIMEYECNGNLFTEIQKHKNGLKETKAHEYFFQLASAIYFLHSNGIIHRDIKPENCLLDINKKIKLCDFGWSTQSVIPRTTFCGTYEYMSPEIIGNRPYSRGVDIWSLGILLYEMLHGHSPFKARSQVQIQNNILCTTPVFKKNISKECKELITLLLNKDEERRITIEGVLQHEWVKKNSFSGFDYSTMSSSLNANQMFDSVLDNLSKKNEKVISPIGKQKSDICDSVSIYKDIKDIIESRGNQMNNYRKKGDVMLSEIKNQSKVKEDYANVNISRYFNDNYELKRNKIVKRKKVKVNENFNEVSDLNEISTQTELPYDSRRRSWNILNIFRCGN